MEQQRTIKISAGLIVACLAALGVVYLLIRYRRVNTRQEELVNYAADAVQQIEKVLSKPTKAPSPSPTPAPSTGGESQEKSPEEEKKE